MGGVRIDKWLWSVRIFKSRTIAIDYCKNGRVEIGGNPVKPSSPVQIGQIVKVKKSGYTFSFKVLQLLEKRVGAVLAKETYEDLTPSEELHKYDEWFIGKARGEFRDRGSGRPTKKDRREIDEFKDFYFPDED